MKKLIRFLLAMIMLFTAYPVLVLAVWASAGEDTLKTIAASIFEDWQRIFWESV